MKHIFSFGFLLFVLSACGGDDNAPDPLQDPTGVWAGEYTVYPLTTPPSDIIGVVWEGRWMFFIDDDYYDILYEGTPIVTGHFFEGEFKFFGTYGVESRYFDGQVFTKSYIYGTTEYDDEITRKVSLYYSDLTERGASLSVLESNWSDTKTYFTTTLSIDSDGIVHGTDTDGCIYNGTIQAPDSDKNIYELEVNVSMCNELDGDYSGLGFTSGPTNDWFEFSISNPNHCINLTLNRI